MAVAIHTASAAVRLELPIVWAEVLKLTVVCWVIDASVEGCGTRAICERTERNVGKDRGVDPVESYSYAEISRRERSNFCTCDGGS